MPSEVEIHQKTHNPCVVLGAHHQASSAEFCETFCTLQHVWILLRAPFLCMPFAFSQMDLEATVLAATEDLYELSQYVDDFEDSKLDDFFLKLYERRLGTCLL